MNLFKLVTRNSILDAIQWYDSIKISAKETWTTFNLVFNQKHYPPREIASKALSYVFKDINELYDIEDALELFGNLGFVVERKNQVWKLGCNWGSGQPSFYELLKREKIVIGRFEKGEYRKNDLILITEGFTVRAIACVKTDILNTIKGSLKSEFEQYNVYAEEQIFYAKVEFYELSPSKIFNYELQQGIIKVRSLQILFKADNLWNNRNVIIDEIYFSEAPRGFDKLDYTTKYPIIIYRKSNWDDYGYSTTFNFDLYYSPNLKLEIGSIKIGNNIDGNINLPKDFKILDDNYFSLGSNIEYYERLREIFPDIFPDILKALRDVANDKTILDKYFDLDIFQKSFLRSSESEYILSNFSQIFTVPIKNISYEFSFKCRVGSAYNDHQVNFLIEDSKSTSSRFYCIVGKNATGKTKYLSHLANKLADNNDVGEFIPARPNFIKIIAASFSYFDKFRLPEKRDTNYDFIGIKDEKGVVNQELNSSRIWLSYKNIAKDSLKSKLWYECLQSSLETDYLNFTLSELRNVSQRKVFIALTENIFSSGQNIVFQFITRFIECIEENSILIFDEPETHLHPNITGRLIRTIDFILKQYKSYCIIATHSPIVVQEIQSKYIRIFDRIENSPVIYAPVIECFGENLSEISNTIFKVDEEKELYKTQLDELIKQNKSFSEINNLFEHGLSLNARIYLLSKMESNL